MRSPAVRLAIVAITLAASAAALLAQGTSGSASRSARAASGPPVAQRTPVVDDYFGTKVTDDYRWMEDRHAPSFEQWCREQGSYARSVLDRIPGRDSLQRRIAAHTGGGTAAFQVHQAGGRVFYLKRAPGQDSFKLFVRDGVDGAEKLLVDPDRGASPGHHFAIDYYEPSPDGPRIAYGISPGGPAGQGWTRMDTAAARDRTSRHFGIESIGDGLNFACHRIAQSASIAVLWAPIPPWACPEQSFRVTGEPSCACAAPP